MYEMKLGSLPNLLANYFQSIATIHSYNIGINIPDQTKKWKCQ